MLVTRSARVLLASLAFTLVPVAAHAQFTVYTDLASYLAAVSNPGTDTFDGFDIDNATPGPINRSAGAYSYRGTTTPSNLFFGAGTVADEWLSTNTATDAMVFDNFTGGVFGIGGFFFGSNISGQFRAGTDITLSATNANGTTSVTALSTTQSTFFGFVSTGGVVTSFSVASVQPDAGFAWPTINDLTLGGAAATVVPEPSTYAMMAMGLLGLAAAARRRRTR